MLKNLLETLTGDIKESARIMLIIAIISTFIADKIGMNFIGIIVAIVAAIGWVTWLAGIILTIWIKDRVENDYLFMKRKDFMEKYEEYIEE